MMYDDLRTQLEQVGRLPVPEPRPEFTDSLLARIQAVEQISSMSSPAAPVVMRGAHRLRIVTAGAVAAAFLSVVGYVSMQGADEVPITMTASFGTVEVTRDDGTVLLNPGGETRLQPGDTVYVSGGSKVEIGGNVIEGGKDGIALVVDENGVTAPSVTDATLATDDPTTSTETSEEATTAPSETSEAAEVTVAVAPEAEAVEKNAGDDDLSTTTGSSAAIPSTTAEKTPPTTVAPAPTEPIIVEPSEVPTTVLPTTLPAEDEKRADALELIKLTTDGERFTLEWAPYPGDDFGCYLILYTEGSDLSTTDSTSYPLVGDSTTKLQGTPVLDQAQQRAEFDAPGTSGVVRYRVVATDGPCTSIVEGEPVAYGNLVAISGEAHVTLQEDPASSAVEHSTNSHAEFQRVGEVNANPGS